MIEGFESTLLYLEIHSFKIIFVVAFIMLCFQVSRYVVFQKLQ